MNPRKRNPNVPNPNVPYPNPILVCATSYLSVGFGLYFILTPLTFYMVDDLNATASQQTVVNGLLSLPWALKIGASCCHILESYYINVPYTHTPLSHLIHIYCFYHQPL